MKSVCAQEERNGIQGRLVHPQGVDLSFSFKRKDCHVVNSLS